jgi:tRNA A-37 threonylcarbamoyl transferase component Bud32
VKGELADVKSELKGELADVKSELKGELADVKGELTDVKGELTDVKGELVDVKGELKDELTDVKGELKGEIANVKVAMTETVVHHSYASNAKGVEKALTELGRWEKIAEASSGQAVVASKLLASKLAVCRNEAAIVNALTQRLESLCVSNDPGDPCPMVLVNSENYAWLRPEPSQPSSNLDFKPDLWLTWKPFVLYKTADDARFPQGVLAGAALQHLGCIAGFLEAKDVPLRAPEFGKLVTYHSCVGKHASCHGMLFNAEAFFLYATTGGYPIKRIDGTLKQKGSARVVSDFFASVKEPSLLQALRLLLQVLETRPVHVAGQCYLGSGAHGHVFTVAGPASGGGGVRALKVVLFHNKEAKVRFIREFACMREAAKAGAPVVHAVDATMHSVDLDDGTQAGGYLLETVGKPLLATGNRIKLSTVKAAFEVLASLHSHEIIHGDARLANLVYVGTTLKWIDICVGQPSVAAEFQRSSVEDVESLARSALLLRYDAPLPGAVASAAAAYRYADEVSVRAVIDAVWAASATEGKRAGASARASTSDSAPAVSTAAGSGPSAAAGKAGRKALRR